MDRIEWIEEVGHWIHDRIQVKGLGRSRISATWWTIKQIRAKSGFTSITVYISDADKRNHLPRFSPGVKLSLKGGGGLFMLVIIFFFKLLYINFYIGDLYKCFYHNLLILTL